MNDKQTNYNFSALDFSRVAIIGCPGSGKTTFSNSFGAVFSREVVHLDKVLWRKNWEMPSYDQRKIIHDGIIEQNSWIIDGMWKSHLEDRIKRATLVIFLDYKRSICVWRALKRRIKYSGKQRDDIADGCLEKLDGYFMRYIWTFRKKSRPQILKILSQHSYIKIIQLKTPKQTETFLRELQIYQQSKS